jgi:hypothetical protein
MARFDHLTGGQGGFNNALQNVPGGGSSFRLALAPSIVNPRYNRLWLIPLDGTDTAVAPSPFDSIVSEFREILIALGEHDLSVRGILAQYADDYTKSVWVWGGRIHPEIDGEMRHFELYVAGLDQDIARRFHQTAARAGALIPNRIRDAVSELFPTTAFAWWMAAVWEFSTIEPDVSPDPDDECKCGGPSVFWGDPISASLSAIEAAGLVTPQPGETKILVGVWSLPMSKADFARRVLQNRMARPRDVHVIFDRLEKQQVEGSTKWSFRLDTLDESLRKKLGDSP